MIRCRDCGGANPDENTICQYCAQDLPPEPVREYLLRNSPIFTVGALFTALTFYLLGLVKQSQLSVINGTVSIISLSQNNSQTIIKPGNFTYVISLQPGSIFQNSFAIPFIPLNETLILAFLACFLILCGIIGVLLKDLYKVSRGNPQIYHVFVFFLLTSFVVLNIFYILSNFLNESVYFVFFGFWVIYGYITLICWKITIKYIKKPEYVIATVFLIVVGSIFLIYVMIYPVQHYVPTLNNQSLEITLSICLIITVLMSIMILSWTLFLGGMLILAFIIARIIKMLIKYSKSHPNGIISRYMSVPNDFIENCKEIFSFR